MDNIDNILNPAENSENQENIVPVMEVVEQQEMANDAFFAAEDDFVFAEEPDLDEQSLEEEPILAAEPVSVNVPESFPNHKKRGCKWVKRIVATLLICALVAGSCFVTAVLVNNDWNERLQHLEQDFDKKLESVRGESPAVIGNVQNDSTILPAPVEGLTPAQVYERNVLAVVAVSNQATVNYYGQVSETASSGTGFIISKDGYVVTNYHVVEGATTLTVITYDGKEHPAELIGYDATNELALMKIEGQNLPCVSIGSSEQMVVGDQVVAIGNPLGELTSTLTVGYISAKDRIVNTEGVEINMLQTDAAINSGNSGGPLFNMKGEVIGITTAKASGTSNSGVTIEGIGFAVPIDDVIDTVEDLKEYGYVTGAYIGVEVRDVDETAQTYGLPAGAYINSVVAGAAAEKAGIQAQDIIVKVGGYDVTSVNELTRILKKFNSGDTTTVTVYRSGTMLELTIVFDEKPREAEVQQPQETVPQQTEPQQGSDWFDDWWNWNPFFGW